MLKTLLLINLKGLLISLFNGGNSKTTKKKSPFKKKITVVLVAILAVYIIASMMLSVSLLFNSISSSFGKTELEWLYFALVGSTVFLFTFIGSVFTTQSIIFNSKDNELLLSMPIPTFYILASRISILFSVDLVYALLLAIPTIGIYFYQFGFDAKMLIIYFICILFTVVFSAAITCFFGWIIALISSKLKKGTLFQTLFSVLFLAAYMLVFTNIQNYISIITTNGEQIAKAFRNYLPIFYFFGTAVSKSNLLPIAALIAISVLLFALACLLISKSFIKITTSKKQGKKKLYVEKELNVSSAKQALLRKELSRFFSLPMYILNCGMGSFMMLVFSIFILIRGKDILYAFQTQSSTDFESLIPVIICAAFGFCSGTCNSSAVSTSLEGSRINIIRSMPINASDFFFAKYMSNAIITLPVLVLSLTISAIGLKMNFTEAVAASVASIAFFALTNFINMFCNTLLPRFIWNAEITVIKQGMSVLAGIFANLAVCGTAFAPFFILQFGISASTYLWVVSAAAAIICLLFIRYFKNGGKIRFENMYV